MYSRTRPTQSILVINHRDHASHRIIDASVAFAFAFAFASPRSMHALPMTLDPWRRCASRAHASRCDARRSRID
jgi:hypothetical protein